MNTNTPELTTDRLLLRKFTENDTETLFSLLSDTTVNTFLPWFPVQNRAETLRHLKERYLCHYTKAQSHITLYASGRIPRQSDTETSVTTAVMIRDTGFKKNTGAGALQPRPSMPLSMK